MFVSLCDFICSASWVIHFMAVKNCFPIGCFANALSLEVDAQRDQTPSQFRISQRVRNVQGSLSPSPNPAVRMSGLLSLHEVMPPKVCNMTTLPHLDGCCDVRCDVWLLLQTVYCLKYLVTCYVRLFPIFFPGARVFIERPSAHTRCSSNVF